MKNIVLTGFMAAGKSEIGRYLAKLSGFQLIDTDKLIVSKANRSINDIFAEYGEDYFRNLETQIVHEISAYSDTVISTGGGIVLRNENMAALRQTGIIFYLNPPFSVIEERLAKAMTTRPLLQNQDITEIRQRFLDRKPFYENCDYKVPVSNEFPPKQFAIQIWEQYQNKMGLN